MPDDCGIAVTVHHDGRFWVAYCEEWGALGRRAAVHVFGNEPALPEIAAFLNSEAFLRLEFAPLDEERPHRPLAGNPKRRQREAARCAREATSSTRSQTAAQAALGERKLERRSEARQHARVEARERWRQRVEKRREKHRGH